MRKNLILWIITLCACFSLASCTKQSGAVNSGNSSLLTESSENSDEVSSSVEQPNKEENLVVITFKQDGEDDIIKTIKKGENLTDIPVPTPKIGYTIVWDKNEFTNVNENVIVTAIETAKMYTIQLNANGGSVAQTTLTVTYGQDYQLATPKHAELIFKGWSYDGKIIDLKGVWSLDVTFNEITLKAEWRKGTFTGNY